MTKRLSLIIGQFHYSLYFQKIFKKFIYETLYQHLTSKNILVKEQFGFRYNNSTEIAIYTLINNILSFLNVSSAGENMEGVDDP